MFKARNSLSSYEYDWLKEGAPRPKRIQFHSFYARAVEDVTVRQMACGNAAAPAQLVAPARAGSNVTYHWSPWLPSHRGPMTSYLAPYSGATSRGSTCKRARFFKIAAEEALHADGTTWATDRLIAGGGLWTTGIPARDVRPGGYDAAPAS